tara:strand:- start:6541 stop:6840 length:300 start_codon:yes stop_codon:yes gene_type:complete
MKAVKTIAQEREEIEKKIQEIESSFKEIKKEMDGYYKEINNDLRDTLDSFFKVMKFLDNISGYIKYERDKTNNEIRNEPFADSREELESYRDITAINKH